MYMYKASTGNIICPVVMLNYLKGDEEFIYPNKGHVRYSLLKVTNGNIETLSLYLQIINKHECNSNEQLKAYLYFSLRFEMFILKHNTHITCPSNSNNVAIWR